MAFWNKTTEATSQEPVKVESKPMEEIKRMNALYVGSTRSFAAAEVSRLVGTWSWDEGFSNREISAQLGTIRSRSREMAKNSPHHKRFLDLFVSNVVGTGFSLKSTPHDGVAGMAGYKPDDMAAKFFQFHWWRWGSNKRWCDATGRKTFSEICRLCARTWARDGEYFVMINRNAQNPYGMSLRVIRPDSVAEKYNAVLKNGNIVRSGVELDADMTPVAYYLFTTKEFEQQSFSGGSLFRVPASNMIHGYVQEDEDQTRGIPRGHAVLKKLKMLEQYDEAELVAARDEANTVGIYHAPAGKEGDIVNLADPDDKNAQAMRANLYSDSLAGSKILLPQGWQFDSHTPQHPNREVTAYKNSMLRDAASGYGIEYSCFANDWAGVTYSSVRAGTLSERDMWKIAQEQMMSQLCTPSYEAWMYQLLSLAISGNFPLAKYDKFVEHYFRGKRWGWVDPMKDAKSSEIAVAHGWKTDAQIADEYEGDFDDNIEEIKRLDEAKKGTSLEVINETKATTATATK